MTLCHMSPSLLVVVSVTSRMSSSWGSHLSRRPLTRPVVSWATIRWRVKLSSLWSEVRRRPVHVYSSHRTRWGTIEVGRRPSHIGTGSMVRLGRWKELRRLLLLMLRVRRRWWLLPILTIVQYGYRDKIITSWSSHGKVTRTSGCSGHRLSSCIH